MASAGPRIGHRYHQTSEHLMKLLEAGLLVVERSGRHRYYRLAGEPVARALEALAVIAPPRPIRSLRESEPRKALVPGPRLRFLALGWMQRLEGSRAVRITDQGWQGLRQEFGLEMGGPGGVVSH